MKQAAGEILRPFFGGWVQGGGGVSYVGNTVEGVLVLAIGRGSLHDSPSSHGTADASRRDGISALRKGSLQDTLKSLS